jgi:hypothetical protein
MAASQRFGRSACLSANSFIYLSMGLLLVFGIHMFMRARPLPARVPAGDASVSEKQI